MKNHFILIIFLFSSVLVKRSQAADDKSNFNLPKSKTQVCENFKNKYYTQRTNNFENLLLRNTSGWLNTGLCWWTSRLQRSALYLAYLSPNKPKPNKLQAKKIIRKLFHMRSLVEVPGYSNFYDFFIDYNELIENQLSAKQIEESYTYFSHNMPYAKNASHKRLKKEIASLKKVLSQKDLPYMIIKYKDRNLSFKDKMTNHSVLANSIISGQKKNRKNCELITYLDSNDFSLPEVMRIKKSDKPYEKTKQKAIQFCKGENFGTLGYIDLKSQKFENSTKSSKTKRVVFFNQRNRDLKKLQHTLKSECQ